MNGVGTPESSRSFSNHSTEGVRATFEKRPMTSKETNTALPGEGLQPRISLINGLSSELSTEVQNQNKT